MPSHNATHSDNRRYTSPDRKTFEPRQSVHRISEMLAYLTRGWKRQTDGRMRGHRKDWYEETREIKCCRPSYRLRRDCPLHTAVSEDYDFVAGTSCVPMAMSNFGARVPVGKLSYEHGTLQNCHRRVVFGTCMYYEPSNNVRTRFRPPTTRLGDPEFSRSRQRSPLGNTHNKIIATIRGAYGHKHYKCCVATARSGRDGQKPRTWRTPPESVE